MTHWRTILKSLGFSDSEAGVYLAALEYGPLPVQVLAKHARVSRVTTYAVIESLFSRGLMSWVEKGKKKLFTAESPERLLSYISKSVKEMESTLKEVESSIEELKLLQRGEKPVVKLFEGIEGLRAIADDITRSQPPQVLEMGNWDEIQSVLKSEDLEPVRKQLKLSNIDVLAIYATRGTTESSVSKTHIVSDRHLSLKGDIIVYSHKIAFSTFRGKLMSVLVESEDIAHSMRQIFHALWKQQGT